VPQNPNASFQTNPTLAGLVYQDLNTGGVWLVGEGGQVRPLLDQWTAVISPDGALALFEKGDDIYLADLATGTWRNLTNTPDRWESNPQFVPGAAGLAFFFSGGLAEERISGQLTVIGLDGSAYSVLVEQTTSVAPAFSQDGSRMAFSLGDTAWIYNMENGNSTAFEPTVFGLSGARVIVSPAWSPDERMLAWWVVTGEGTDSRTALALFDLNTNTHRLIHSYQPIGGGGFNTAPVWSPDGLWMATTVLSENGKASLWVFSVDGEEVELGDMAYPLWTSGGEALLVNVWPQDGAAFGAAAVLFLPGEWIPNTLDLNPGSVLLAFLDLLRGIIIK
jgi:Tol biopolymer transport system component